MKNKEKIDIVIPWVDGSDPQWLKEKNNYIDGENQDNREIRFRDWDLLKFWFRGVEENAPWINKIFFVTWGHVPEWLDTANPRICIVKHNDYIPGDYLPTFSSHTIELNMHRINNLSDHFIYFNDDVYLLNPVKPSDFFINGKPCDCLVESAITPRIGEFSSILCETTGVINRHFKKSDIYLQGLKYYNPRYKELLIRSLTTLPYHHIMGFYNPHICVSYTKDIFEKVWKTEFDKLDETCQHKFREKNDVSQYLIRYWRLCEGNFVPRYPIGKCINVDVEIEEITKYINDKKIKVLAINDKDTVVDYEKKAKSIQNVFLKKYPNKSSFEL